MVLHVAVETSVGRVTLLARTGELWQRVQERMWSEAPSWRDWLIVSLQRRDGGVNYGGVGEYVIQTRDGGVYDVVVTEADERLMTEPVLPLV